LHRRKEKGRESNLKRKKKGGQFPPLKKGGKKEVWGGAPLQFLPPVPRRPFRRGGTKFATGGGRGKKKGTSSLLMTLHSAVGRGRGK